MANGNFGGGTGTTTDPFLVEDAHDFNAIRNNLGSNYKQVANIDLIAYPNFEPLSGDNIFTGAYDGGGFLIKNLFVGTVESPVWSYKGLFGGITPTAFANVHILNGHIYSIGDATVIGSIYSSARFYNCSNRGCNIDITSSGRSSGLFITRSSGTRILYGCWNNANINFHSTVSSGIINGSDSECHRCYNTGNIISSNSGTVYGVCEGIAYDCYNSGNLKASNTYGVSSYLSRRSYNTGILTGYSQVFGITAGSAYNCYQLAPYIARSTGSSTIGSFYAISRSSSSSGNYVIEGFSVQL